MESRREQAESNCASSDNNSPPIPETEMETPISVSTLEGGGSAFNQSQILRAIEVVERDSFAIAQSFTSLFASLRLALSNATATTIDHMQCFSDASGRVQESVLDAATKGNRYINSCLRLNEEMKNIDGLASQLSLPWLFSMKDSSKLALESRGCGGGSGSSGVGRGASSSKL